jgi:hypothetical protein
VEHRLAAYCKSVDHNELELALDALEEVAKMHGSTGQTWSQLAAAESMMLTARAELLRRRS